MLRKSSASNCGAAIFNKCPFFLELFKSYKIDWILAFFLFQNSVFIINGSIFISNEVEHMF